MIEFCYNFTIKITLTNNKSNIIIKYLMATHTIAKQLDASRRLEEELAIERHRQELEKQKIDR